MKDSVRSDYYDNLEIISAAARKAGKPFWGFVLSVSCASYEDPSLPGMRMQAFTNLAYGASCIEYFTYWTPHDPVWNFHNAPIDSAGNRSPVYQMVRALNREIQSYAGAFAGAKVISVGHTGSAIPKGTRPFVPFAPFTEVTTGGKGAVVSRIENDGAMYLVVVNRDYRNEMPLTAAFDRDAKIKRIGKNGGKISIKAGAVSGSVPPGDMAVFRVGK
jgi:hypothetical protein